MSGLVPPCIQWRGSLSRNHSSFIFYLSLSDRNQPTRPPLVSPLQELQRNRLARFTYIPGDPAGTKATEEVLLTTVPKSTSIHSAGWLGFKPSVYGEVSGGCLSVFCISHAGDQARHATEGVYERKIERVRNAGVRRPSFCGSFCGVLFVIRATVLEQSCGVAFHGLDRALLRYNTRAYVVLNNDFTPTIFVGVSRTIFRSQSDPQDLYWTTGDGGPQTDYENHSQDTQTMLGAMMRITVPSDGSGYTIPSGNYGGIDDESVALPVFFFLLAACEGIAMRFSCSPSLVC